MKTKDKIIEILKKYGRVLLRADFGNAADEILKLPSTQSNKQSEEDRTIEIYFEFDKVFGNGSNAMTSARRSVVKWMIEDMKVLNTSPTKEMIEIQLDAEGLDFEEVKPPTKDEIIDWNNHSQWIYDRMINVHGEKEAYDYMIKFKQFLSTQSDGDNPYCEWCGKPKRVTNYRIEPLCECPPTEDKVADAEEWLENELAWDKNKSTRIDIYALSVVLDRFIQSQTKK